jgi:hypothetical protein
MTTTGSPRRPDLDLMRAMVVGGLIFFHTARIFDPLDFYVKDQPPNLPLTLFVLFAGLWGMPLLFVVSGLGAWYSLRSRTATGFARERLARLGVPFLVGLLVVVPPQVYYQLRFEGQDPGSYWAFYREFFQVHLGIKFPWFIRPDDPPDLFEPAHLWFLYFLLVYSLLLLPLLLYLRGNCWSGWPPSAPDPGRSSCSPCLSPSSRRPSALRSPGAGTATPSSRSCCTGSCWPPTPASARQSADTPGRPLLSAFSPCSCCLASASMSAKSQDEIRRLPMTAGACCGGS